MVRRLRELLERRELTPVFQPLVELAGGRVVAFEALVRGPADSPLHRPDALFREAREEGLVPELDALARERALELALASGLAGPATLFLNAEPEGLVLPEGDRLPKLRRRAAAVGLQVVLEITERALTERPAELLAAVERVREWGWRIAVDDVGAERASLALLPFLQPDVVKLDLRLVQERTTVEVAEIVNAVRAHAEWTGARLLAEGIETEEHAALAHSMGAQYGQGWLFGRPGPVDGRGVDAVLELPPALPVRAVDHLWQEAESDLPVHRATKPLLVSMSKTLERQALANGDAAVVIGTFQHARYFTPASAARYATLAASASFVAALATDLPPEPVPGVRGTHLPADDPLTAEWDLAVVGPHFAAALVARDLGDAGAEQDRRFDYVLTYDRARALAIAGALVRRVGRSPGVLPPKPSALLRRHALPLRRPTGGDLDRLLRRAVAASGSGITIADAQAPDCPLVFVNPAFERLTGYTAAQVLGSNCRFLQDERTDPDALRLLREQLRLGRKVSTTLLNRRADGTSWWNELSISPVRSPDGDVTHFIGIQNDVTARLLAERRLARLAHSDVLTGVANRAGLTNELERVLARGTRHALGTGLLFVDLDGFKRVNDERGHAAGDEVLCDVARSLSACARPDDVVARLGGDEFAVVLAALPGDRQAVDLVVTQVASRVARAVADLPHGLRASIGTALHPYEVDDLEGLFALADARMYDDKARARETEQLRRTTGGAAESR